MCIRHMSLFIAFVFLFLGGCSQDTADSAASGSRKGGTAAVAASGTSAASAASAASVASASVEPVSSVAAVAVASPAWQPVIGRTVILDAGHGGKDPGANHFGLREKDIALDLALRTAVLLRERGVVVLMTRQTDVFIPLPERSAFANRYPNAVLLSIHVNASASNPNASGVETYVLSRKFADAERGQTAARKYRVAGTDADRGARTLADLATRSRGRGPLLAKCLQTSLAARLGESNRGVNNADLSVLRETYFCTAALVEVGFLTHPPTAMRMRTVEWRGRTAEGLAAGVMDFLRQPE